MFHICKTAYYYLIMKNSFMLYVETIIHNLQHVHCDFSINGFLFFIKI